MRGGLLRSWSGLAVLGLLGACSNIIGISSYEIDPTLDESAGGSTAQGGKKGGGPSAGNSTEGGDETGGSNVGGSVVTAGNSGQGGDSGGTSGTGGTGGTAGQGGDSGGTAGDGGQAGAPPNGCVAADCDDGIDCTIDDCDADGKCVHTPDNTVCSPLAGNCATCTAGVGCVEKPGTVKELLLDPGFDLKSGDWVDYRDGLPASVIADAAAQTPANSVRLGPAPNNATEQGFTDLSQEITIPKNAISLVVSGYFKLTPGKVGDLTRDANDDYTTLTLFSLADENNDFTRFVDYHEWDGYHAAQATWKAFSYSTSKAVLAKVLDQDVTLDLVTETWDSRFMFDSLSLKVTTCE